MTKDPLIHPDPEVESAVEPGSSKLRNFMRYAGYPAALMLLGLCIYLAFFGGQNTNQASGFEHLQNANAVQIIIMLACVLASVIINGYIFWALLKPFQSDKPVPLITMTKLIAATSLLNYLPMRAGLVGRAAYLRQYHNIPYRVSVLMLFIAAGFTVCSFTIILFLNIWRTRFDLPYLISILTLVLILTLLAPRLITFATSRFPGLNTINLDWFKSLSPTRYANIYLWLWARILDAFCNAVRLYVAAQILDIDLNFLQSLTFAVAGMFVTLVTPLPNGLGLRELLYGLLGSIGIEGQSISETHLTLALIDRVIEAAVFVTTGLLSMGILHQRVKASD